MTDFHSSRVAIYVQCVSQFVQHKDAQVRLFLIKKQIVRFGQECQNQRHTLWFLMSKIFIITELQEIPCFLSQALYVNKTEHPPTFPLCPQF
jgi:hypothetical protein